MEHSLKKQCTWLKPTQADGQTHTQEHTHKHPWRLAAKKKSTCTVSAEGYMAEVN